MLGTKQLFSLWDKQGWAHVLFKRTQRSCVLLHSFQNNETFSRSFAFYLKRTKHSLHSFTFFIKKTQRSLRSFTFFIKERKRTLQSFWFHKSYKNDKSRKKKNVKECSVLFIWLNKNLTFFIYIIYICIYLYISIYIFFLP